jgi:tRNA(adenine34) deaminase
LEKITKPVNRSIGEQPLCWQASCDSDQLAIGAVAPDRVLVLCQVAGVRSWRRRAISKKRWVSKVKTVSTFPPQGTFSKDAKTIARTMASKKVSPKALGSAIRMVQYFINRGGKGLSAARKRELEKAKHILQYQARKKDDDGDKR